MAEKTLKTRIIQKHDTEANWLLATNFTPMSGEIIIYDEDNNHNYKRIKIGNGTDNVNVLDFYAGDWNDLKNKPKYKEETLRTIFQETDIEINEDLYTQIGILMNFKENETYFITLNNILYECKAWRSEGDHYIYIGNGALIEQPEKGDNVPFLLDCNYQDFLVVTEPGTYKLKIETFKNYIHTSQQNLSELEQIQTLINLDLILFEQIGNPIKIKMSNFDENGYYYFNDKEKEKIAVGYSDYKIYAGYNEYEDIGIIEKLKDNHHMSSASIYFKDFLLNNDYIQILRKDINFSFDEFYLMPGKIKIKYDIKPTNDVYLTQEELEDGTKIVYFSQSFKWIYSSIVESQQMVIFREDDAYYLPIEITTGNLKIQGIKDNKIVIIDWNSNEEYGYVTEKILSSSWNDLEDKPFYEETFGINYTWDGNLENVSETYQIEFNGSMLNLIKVSDMVPTEYQMNNCEFVMRETQTNLTETITLDSTWYTIENGYSYVQHRFPSGGRIVESYLFVITSEKGISTLGVPGLGVYVNYADAIDTNFPTYIFSEVHMPEETVIKTLDTKFLPSTSWNDLADRPFYEEEKVGELIHEETYEFTSKSYNLDADLEWLKTLKNGAMYEVNWNGTIYHSKYISINATDPSNGNLIEAWILGNCAELNSSANGSACATEEDTGEPFRFMIGAVNGDVFRSNIVRDVNIAETVNVTIKELIAEVVTIPTKYLPEHLQFGETKNIIAQEGEYTVPEDNPVFSFINTTLDKNLPVKVKYNGTEYESSCEDVELDPGEFATCFGNLSAFGENFPDTGEPFIGMYAEMDGICGVMLMPLDGSTTATIKIWQDGFKKLDNKYLSFIGSKKNYLMPEDTKPEMTEYLDYIAECTLPINAVDFNKPIYFKFDDTVYESDIVVYEDFYVFGNNNNGGMIKINNNELTITLMPPSSTTSVAVWQEQEAIDPKYLPDNIGGNSIQSDWNENDPESSSYIANRPFYTTDAVETIIVEGTITGNEMMTAPASVQSLTLGKTYTVIFDGTTYNLECVDIMGLPGLGSTDRLYNDYPFVIVVQDGTAMAFAENIATYALNITTHSIKVIGYVNEVIKIDDKYIKHPLMIINGTINDEDNSVTIDKTYDEVKKHIKNGGNAVIKAYGRYFTLIKHYDTSSARASILSDLFSFEYTFARPNKVYTGIITIEENRCIYSELSLSLTENEYSDLTTTDKTIIGAINEVSEKSATQSDWNQNDETAPDYVKNRPFYTDYKETELCNGIFPFNSNETFGAYMGILSQQAPDLAIGNNIKIVFDGVEYNSTIQTADVSGFGTVTCFGNMMFLGGENTGEPFIAATLQGMLAMLTTSIESFHNIIVTGIAEENIKIDKKYLPKFTGEDVTGKIYTIDEEEVTAGLYAEVFNDYVNNIASGEYSHAEGYETVANGENQHVQGKYNIADSGSTYAHIVGNGTANDARSNAHTLDWDGNAEFQGDVKANACGGTSPISLVELYNTIQTMQATIIELQNKIATLEANQATMAAVEEELDEVLGV